MKKFENDSTGILSRFGRDRRQRAAQPEAERVERRPRSQRDAADSEHPAGADRPQRRASYNPHFTRDNRPVFETPHGHGGHEGAGRRDDKPRYGKKDYGSDERRTGREERQEGRFAHRDERRPYGESRSSEHRFDKHEGGDRFDGRRDGKPRYGESRFDKRGEGESRDSDRRFEKPRYGSDERRPYGDKPYGSHGKYGHDRDGHRTFGDKPYRGKSDRRPAARTDKPSYPRYNPETPSGAMRLNRFIAQSGICSRREADEFITAGLVSVNGVIVTELGTKVLPSDEVKFNDSRVQGEKKVYLVLNKPKGYVTSLEDPHAGKTVMELVKGACEERIYPVGRLDKNSLGLLLFTNDGDMTKQLTHPSYRKKKIYQVSLDKPLTRADMERIAEGITLEDGEIHADEISYVKENRQEVGIEIHSGRNRIVRRIFEFLGYTVTKLDRVYYAGLTKKNLKRGAWRFLTREEVERLKSGQYE